jgi:hypothetical protein
VTEPKAECKTCPHKVARFPHNKRLPAVTKLVCSGRMEPTTRRPFEPAGAGGVLLGILLAAIAIGALIGWPAGSAGIGALIGAVAGIPLGVYSVYRRYRGSF